MTQGTDPYLSPAASSAPTGTSGKAIAALLLGIGTFFCSIFMAIPALIFGVMSLGDINRSQGRLTGRGLAITGIVLACGISLLQLVAIPLAMLPAIGAARAAARRAATMSQLRMVTLAAHMHHDSQREFPATADDATGAPVSWRVKMLPYLEQSHLYDQYDQKQPWDSAANKAVSGQKVSMYHDTADPDANSNKTYFLAVVGPGTALQADKPLKLDTIRDGQANTILFVEANADRAVPWAEPKDLNYNPADPRAGLGDVRPGGFMAAFADGSVQTISNDIDPAVLRAKMSSAGND